MIFAGVIEALGVLTLLVLWLNKGWLEQWHRARATRWAIGLGAASLILLMLYLILFNFCVITHPLYADRVFFYPFSLSGKAAQMVEMAGSRYHAIGKYGPDAVQDALNALSTAQTITAMVLLLVYQAVFTALTAAFGIVGFHSGRDLP
jgi:hypothetical protein